VIVKERFGDIDVFGRGGVSVFSVREGKLALQPHKVAGGGLRNGLFGRR
jgi:hypothetical protein